MAERKLSTNKLFPKQMFNTKFMDACPDHAFATILEENYVSRLANFSYVPGDCFFDPLHILLHFIYTSLRLRKDTINHFSSCLHEERRKALSSYEVELNKVLDGNAQYLRQRTLRTMDVQISL